MRVPLYTGGAGWPSDLAALTLHPSLRSAR